MLPLTMLRHRVTFTTVLSRKFSIRTVGGLSPADIQLKRDRPMHSYGVARVASMVAEVRGVDTAVSPYPPSAQST